MPPRKKFNITKYVEYVEEIDKSICLFYNCDRGISGKRPANIKRHYRLVHKIQIDDDDSDSSCCNELKASVPKKLKICDKKTIGYEKEVEWEIGTNKSTHLSGKKPSNKGMPYDYELNKVKLEDEDFDTRCSNELATNKIPQASDGITMDNNEFIKSCVGLVVVKNIPFRIFDDHEYFKKIIGPYEQKFGININSKNMSLVVEKASEEIKDIIKSRIDKSMICLKVDVPKEIDKNVLKISIQYINDFKLCINTIGMVEIPKKPTAQFFTEEIRKCLKNFKIDIKQLYSNTFGKFAEVINVAKIKQEVQEENIDSAQVTDRDEENIYSHISTVFPVIRCAADALQLAAYDVLKTLEPEVNACRQIVKSIQTSELAGDIDIFLPSLDNMENLNTTFSMINSILVQKELIQTLDHSLIIGLDDWNFMKNFVRAFNPLIDCTLKFQSDQYIFGDFYRDWLSCELELLDIVDGNFYAHQLCEAMAIRKKTVIENDVFIAALYLDPRYNFSESPLLSDDQKDVALKHLMKTFGIIQQLEATSELEEDKFNIFESEATSIPTEYSLTSSDKYNKLEKHIQQLIATTSSTSSLTKRNLKQKLSLLCERSIEPLDTNVLEYWSKYYRHDLELSKLAQVALAIPVTNESCDVEHAFSSLSDQLGTKKSPSNILLYTFNSDLLQSCNLDFPEIEEILNT